MLLWTNSEHALIVLDEITNHNKLPAGPSGRFPHQPPMLLTLLQLTLICLTNIHPSDEFSFLNVERLRKLVQWLLQQPVSLRYM
jgi:hypothetical protein